jgi:dTDP-4-amino-4,6-dideoxygalactose transaminase
MIPFNKPFLTGKETQYITEAVLSGKISGNGDFTRRCHSWFEQEYGFPKCLLTTSCTDALEMAALLMDIKPGDEVILPSYTFVSTANAFVLRGATLVFADSGAEHPNINAQTLEGLITPRTRAIIPVHYAGMACDMDVIMAIAQKYELFVVEDAAQAIDSWFIPTDTHKTETIANDTTKKPLGSIGHLAAFSFHETKNIISGEGGMLVINDPQFLKRAEIIWEKGTNRAAFWRGEVDKYGWVDIGSSFLPSEVIAAFLFAQLEQKEKIQNQRKAIWKRYYDELLILEQSGILSLPQVPQHATNNAHMFYMVLKSAEIRDQFISYMKSKGVMPVFHYLSLHKSPFYNPLHDGRDLPWSDHYSDCLVRLPLYFDLTEGEQESVIKWVKEFFLNKLSHE